MKKSVEIELKTNRSNVEILTIQRSLTTRKRKMKFHLLWKKMEQNLFIVKVSLIDNEQINITVSVSTNNSGRIVKRSCECKKVIRNRIENPATQISDQITNQAEVGTKITIPLKKLK
ncbi:hypothetical protein RCL_jg8321.t1 [Rhizophagus clarus]|uniref:Uncharacterized protein n=1 Tax=Rhizophagus clarus TaxID=94130 RepID=A0A8H3MBZ6_9GLOM|nr:hypothetical protein RCL_jg8321.t1 [Rhizophagus clarus]